MPTEQLQNPRSRRRSPTSAGIGSRRATRAAAPLGGDSPPRPGPRYVTFGLVAALALFLAVCGGSLDRAFAFLDFASGVLSLVCLTVTVLWGLAATDRTLLGPGHRLVAQAVHRGTAVGGLGFLALHIWVKIAQGSTTTRGAFVPFTDAAQPMFVGLGTLAGYLFLAVAVTGAVRGVFARRGRSRWWRALHMGAYVAWGMSLLHGLRSGRQADEWVMLAYALAVAGVAAVLALRLAPWRNPPAHSGNRGGGRTAGQGKEQR